MIPHALTGLGLILTSAALGAALTYLYWQGRARAEYARGFESGRTRGVLDAADTVTKHRAAGQAEGFAAAIAEARRLRGRPTLTLVGRN